MKNYFLLFTVILFLSSGLLMSQTKGTFTDTRDGKTYKTVKIGTQTWMAENLAYNVENGCLAYENDQNNVATYGYLYTWEIAKDACPSGWHLPDNIEWNTLTKFLGGLNVAGGKLKSTTNWESPNESATNESGFNALPSGSRFWDGKFAGLGSSCCWWSSSISELHSNNVFHFNIWYFSQDVDYDYCLKSNYFSIRCIMD